MISKTILIRTCTNGESEDEGALFEMFRRFGSMRKIVFTRLFENPEGDEIEIRVTYFNLESAIRAVVSKDKELLEKKVKVSFWIKREFNSTESSFLSDESLSEFELEEGSDDEEEGFSSDNVSGMIEEEESRQQLIAYLELGSDIQQELFQKANSDSSAGFTEPYNLMIENLSSVEFQHKSPNIRLNRIFVAKF